MTRRTLIINGVLVVAIIVIGVVAYSWLHTSSKATAAQQTTTVTQGNITSTVSASGNVSSSVNVGVSFSGCSGVLTSIAVKPGDNVTVGETLATVDNSTATTALNTAETALAQAQANLSNAITAAKTSVTNAQNSYNLDVSQAEAALASANASVTPTNPNTNAITQATNSLASTKLKDQQQITSAQTALTQAEAGTSQQAVAVTTAQTAVTTAQTNLNNCTLTSPIAATVITVNGTVGRQSWLGLGRLGQLVVEHERRLRLNRDGFVEREHRFQFDIIGNVQLHHIVHNRDRRREHEQRLHHDGRYDQADRAGVGNRIRHRQRQGRGCGRCRLRGADRRERSQRDDGSGHHLRSRSDQHGVEQCRLLRRHHLADVSPGQSPVGPVGHGDDHHVEQAERAAGGE